MKIFKKVGRIFLVLTEEEKYIKPEFIKAILIIYLEEAHFEKALETIKKRFPLAEIRIIHNNKAIGIISKLWELRKEQFSAVVVLSLSPLVIFFMSLIFRCYFLIHNKFDQCFLIRKKTLYEFLVGRRGADKESSDWVITPARQSLARFIILLIFLPLIFIKNIFRSIKLIIYIFINLLQLYMIRYCYRFINWRKA